MLTAGAGVRGADLDVIAALKAPIPTATRVWNFGARGFTSRATALLTVFGCLLLTLREKKRAKC